MKPATEGDRRRTITLTLLIAGGCVLLLGAILLLVVGLQAVFG